MSDRDRITGPRSDGTDRRLLFIGHGSMQAAIHARNAMFRLKDVALDGYFSRIDYVFYRTPEPGEHEVMPGFRVHDVSGRVPGILERNRWLRRAALLESGLADIARIARACRPTVICTAEPFIPGALALAAGRLLRVPVVVSLVSDYQLSFEAAGQNPIEFLPPRATFAVEREVLSRADLVMMDTEHYGRYAVKRGTRPDRVRVVPRYCAPIFYEGQVDPAIFQRLAIGDDRPLVYVGRLSPEKYALDLVDALAEVHRRHPERRLLIIGDGPQREHVWSKARGMGLEHLLVQRTGLSAADILSATGSAGAVIVTHGGYALLECCLAGARVVAYDYEWHPEIIRPGETGLLAPYRDARALGAGAADLLDDPDGARRLGVRAREVALDRYSRARNIEAQVNVYRDALGER